MSNASNQSWAFTVFRVVVGVVFWPTASKSFSYTDFTEWREHLGPWEYRPRL